MKQISIAAAFVSLWVMTMPAYAQAVPPTITMQEIQNLTNALRILDGGSVDQCDPAKAPKEGKPSPCQYRKSPVLIRAMAQNMVAMQPFETEFKIEQNAVRTEILGHVADVCAATEPAGACDRAKAEHESKFFEKIVQILATKRPVSLTHIKMVDLDVGEAPEHNKIAAEVIAGLAPMLDDLMPAAK